MMRTPEFLVTESAGFCCNTHARDLGVAHALVNHHFQREPDTHIPNASAKQTPARMKSRFDGEPLMTIATPIALGTREKTASFMLLAECAGDAQLQSMAPEPRVEIPEYVDQAVARDCAVKDRVI